MLQFLKQLLSTGYLLSAFGRLYRALKKNTAAHTGCVVVFGPSVVGYQLVYRACRKESGWLCRILCMITAPFIIPVCALVTWAIITTVVGAVSLPVYRTLMRIPEALASRWLDYDWFEFITSVFHGVVSTLVEKQSYLASAEFMAMGIVLSLLPLGFGLLSWRLPCRQLAKVAQESKSTLKH